MGEMGRCWSKRINFHYKINKEHVMNVQHGDLLTKLNYVHEKSC